MAFSSSRFLVVSLVALFSSGRTDIDVTECNSPSSLDVIIILDSSGSVYDAEYTNWESELSLAQSFVEHPLLPLDTRVGLINFSGCSSSYTFETCQTYTRRSALLDGRLRLEWGLTTYGNDLDSTAQAIDAMGPDFFLSGYTWTDAALTLALNEFELNSGPSRSKLILIITDGNPTTGWEPCTIDTTTNTVSYTSATYDSLVDINTYFIPVAVEGSQAIGDEFFDCLSDSFFKVDGFNDLLDSSLVDDIASVVCTIPEPPTESPTECCDDTLPPL